MYLPWWDACKDWKPSLDTKIDNALYDIDNIKDYVVSNWEDIENIDSKIDKLKWWVVFKKVLTQRELIEKKNRKQEQIKLILDRLLYTNTQDKIWKLTNISQATISHLYYKKVYNINRLDKYLKRFLELESTLNTK